MGSAEFERLSGFGGSLAGVSQVFRPTTADELCELFRAQPFAPRSVGLRGAGQSYGDAAMNSGGAVIDTSRLDRIESWDPQTGVVEAQPGVTIERLWRRSLKDGWWPPVCPGTMSVSLGGAVSMNIHGKNSFRVGPFGEHVQELELVLPTGERAVCGPGENPDLFRAVVGGFGMLGCVTRVRLGLKRVHSGSVSVRALPARSLRHMAEIFEENAADADYLVGWCDGMAGGKAIGRGVVHRGDTLGEGIEAARGLDLDERSQALSPRLFGLFPRSWAWMGLRAANSNLGMRVANSAKLALHRLQSKGPHLWSHVQFHFLMDYFPDWIRGYGPSGLIQVQPFVPREGGVDVLEEVLRCTKEHGIPPYLVVFKKHRPDPFLMTHGLDGYSLAMDFPARKRQQLWALAREIQQITVEAGGRFYLAKDSTLTADALLRYVPDENLRLFRELKQKCDPDGLLQTDLARRIWPDLFRADGGSRD